MDNKPDWKDAPEWANYLAMDQNGDWYWFENLPSINRDVWASPEKATLAQKSSNHQWKDSVEERPQ